MHHAILAAFLAATAIPMPGPGAMATILVYLGNPLTWFAITAFLLPELIRLVVKGDAFGVQVFSRLGNAPLADLTSLAGDAAQGILAAVKAGKNPGDALQDAKAAALAIYAQQKGRAIKDVDDELGLALEGKIRIHYAAIMPTVSSGNVSLNLPTLALLLGCLLIGLGARAQTMPQNCVGDLMIPEHVTCDQPIPVDVPATDAAAGLSGLSAADRAVLFDRAHAERIAPVASAAEELVGEVAPTQIAAPLATPIQVGQAAAPAVTTPLPGPVAMPVASDVAPLVLDHWELAALTPGARFNVSGGAPVEFAAGSGIGFDYLFGKMLFTPPNTTTPIPWFGVSLFLQGSVNVTNLAETENATVGAGVIFLDHVTAAVCLDLAAASINGPPSGILTGTVGLQNLGIELFWSEPFLAL